MCANLLTFYACVNSKVSLFSNYRASVGRSTIWAVVSLERQLIRAWRKRFGLTLEELGKGFRPHRDRHMVGQIEGGRGGSMRVSLLIDVIHAFTRVGRPIGPPGASDSIRLSIFFAGPDAADAREAFVRSARDVVAQEVGERE
jgi:hypothetical protein